MIRPAPALLSLLCGSILAAESPTLAWRQAEHSVALTQADSIVWQFNHGAEHPKPCFHPMGLAGGPVLTWFRPADHTWHRSLWFSWKFINGVNYWEEDKATGLSAGRTETLRTQVKTDSDFSAHISQQLRYRPGTADPVLTEDRQIDISRPAADGGYTMDWTMTFTALTDVLLDRTPLPDEPDGKVFGGYAGLSVRLVRELADIVVVTTNGPASFVSDRFRGRSPALDYAGKLDGKDMGVAIVDHPANLNAPSPWYAIRGAEMHYFSPAVICYGPHKMKAGDRLTLRYRVLIHPGRWDPARLAEEASRFARGR